MQVIGHVVRGIPVFLCPTHPDLAAGYARVLGYVAGSSYAMFPAYHPLGVHAAEDLKLVFPDAFWTESAEALLTQCVEAAGFEQSQTFPHVEMRYPPYPHQSEAIAAAYWRKRLAIEYDMGLGKTKIAIDVMRMIKNHGGEVPILLLCPSHVQDTWSREIAEHDVDGTLSVRRMLGKRGGTPTAAVRHRIYAEEASNPSDVLIINFELVQNDLEFLESMHASRGGFKTVVIDEAHYLSASGANRTEAALKLIQKIPRRLCLTGTPTMGDPLNRWMLCKILIPSLTPEERKFKLRYAECRGTWLCTKCFAKRDTPAGVRPDPCKARPEHCKWKLEREVVVAYKDLHHLRYLTETYVSVVKTKEECLTLPERVIEDVPVYLSDELKTAYNNMLLHGVFTDYNVLGHMAYRERSPAIRNIRLLQITSGYIRLAEGSAVEHAQVGDAEMLTEEEILTDADIGIECDIPYTKTGDVPHGETDTFGERILIRIGVSPKIAQLRADLQAYVLGEGRKVIVWALERPELDDIELVLRDMDIRYCRVDGESNSKQKTASRDKFNQSEGIMVYLSQISINAGFTINAATVTIYYSVSYKSVDYEQSRDRNYRIGQGEKTLIRRYYVQGSVSEFQLKALGRKARLDDGLRKRALCMACPLVEGCMSNNIFPMDPRCVVLPNRTAKARSQLKELK